jgi:glycosyltransferase involved in cell wall biosynthesis
MKVLYVACRYDPRDPDLASGVDYNCYHAIKRHAANVKVLGPFKNTWTLTTADPSGTPVEPLTLGDLTFNVPKPKFQPSRQAIFVERKLMNLYKRVTKKRYLKFPLSEVWHASKALSQAVEQWEPDVVFTTLLPPLVLYTGGIPCVYRTDCTIRDYHEHWTWPLYGKLALALSVWQENRAFKKCSRVITPSAWARDSMISNYGLEAERIEVFPNPSSLPSHVVPDSFDVRSNKRLESPLRLLAVARHYELKGIDIAVEVVRQLNDMGIPAELTVCATSGPGNQYTKFVGPYKKGRPGELKQYVELYRQSHFLLHPARYESAGIVPGEAAAFGTPTITNNVGGLATTVQDGVSGIVLPEGSPAEEYVRVITGFLHDPGRYYDLCVSTKKRYERELNWDVASRRLMAILREVVSNRERGIGH